LCGVKKRFFISAKTGKRAASSGRSRARTRVYRL
jgi:hypothetical protein